MNLLIDNLLLYPFLPFFVEYIQMLNRYLENERNPVILRKSVIIGLLGVIGIVGVITMLSNRQNSKLLSVLNAELKEFEDFAYTHGKSYGSDEEYNLRFKIFKDNLAYIRVFNSQKKSVVLGVNHLADLEFNEYRKIYLPSSMAQREAINSVSFEGLSTPASVDWRTQGAVTPVKDQGQCGSCWSFSTTGSVEGAWFLSGNPLVSLSEQQLMDCSWTYGNLGCNGGLMDRAFRYIISNGGITTEASYPYTAKNGLCNKSKASQYAASIASYVDVAASNPTALQAAAAQQPVSVAVDASSEQWQLYKSGTITSDCGNSLNHGVLVVGYDTTASPPYWIVKNSWGTSWGLAGYIQIEISAGDGVCGINMQPSYPVV